MRRLICLALVSASCITGCAYANPETRLHGGPFGWGFSDGKDNDITLDEASYDDQGRFSLKGLVIRNNASDVRVANVEQMRAHADQIRAFSTVVTEFAKVVAAVHGKSLAPGVAVTVVESVPEPVEVP